MKSKTIAVSLLSVAVGVWLYFTPHLAVGSMKDAAQARNAEKLSSYVDFPALKESLKSTFNSKLAKEVAAQGQDEPFAAMGAMFAAALINPMIDAMVSPEGLAMMLQGEKPGTQAGDSQAQNESTGNEDTNTSMSYEGLNTFVVKVSQKDRPEEQVSLVFQRSGIVSWKLSAMRIPM